MGLHIFILSNTPFSFLYTLHFYWCDPTNRFIFKVYHSLRTMSRWQECSLRSVSFLRTVSSLGSVNSLRCEALCERSHEVIFKNIFYTLTQGSFVVILISGHLSSTMSCSPAWRITLGWRLCRLVCESRWLTVRLSLHHASHSTL